MDIDSLTQIQNIDKSNMLASVMALPQQLRQAAEDLKAVKAPVGYGKINSVVVAGMGASALGGHMVKALFGAKLAVSLEVASDYHLPGHMRSDTLVILSSYSGSTEETLSCSKEAIKCGSKILVLTGGGELAKLARKNNWPGYIWKAKNNPCGSPRMGLGYSLFGLLLWLGKLGIIKFGAGEIKKTIAAVEDRIPEWAIESTWERNQSKFLAQKMLGKVPVFLAHGSLAGNAHAWANQINENAKSFSSWFVFPEINHHLMEGLVKPMEAAKQIVFVLAESVSEDAKTQKRIALTKEVIKKSGWEYVSYHLQEKDKLAQAFEMLALGGFVSFYLAMLYEIDPTPIPAVNYFKERL